MRCASCSFENEAGAQFCEECGAKLVRACPSCGREVRPTAKFCPACGAPLTVQALTPRPRLSCLVSVSSQLHASSSRSTHSGRAGGDGSPGCDRRRAQDHHRSLR